MSFCCGRETVVKKKKVTPVYERHEHLPQQQAASLFPTKLAPPGTSALSPEATKTRKKRFNRTKAVYLEKDNDFKAIESQQLQSKNVMKKILPCGFEEEELRKKYQGSKDKWEDVDFNYEGVEVRGQPVKWKRPEEFIDNPDLFPDEVSPNDIIQGQLNNCYFLSALSALAERPYRIYSLFSSHQYNPNGWYICKLNFNGIYQEVIVDDLFPVNKDGKPVFSQPAQGRFIWAMILEKCWAKLLHGYQNCNYGYTNEAFQTLTGAPTKAYLLRQYASVDPTFESMFRLLKESDQKGYAIQISRNRGRNYQEEKKSVLEEGLPMGHAYSLLGVYETTLKNGKTVKFMQVRNPWATQQSQIGWNDNDPRWDLVYPQEKERMQFRYNKNANDGVFYMDWDDFIKKFDHLFSICEINDNANYIYYHLSAKDRQPLYLQVKTDGTPEDVAIYFVQEMQQHFKQNYRYCGVSVVASRQTKNQQGEYNYQYLGAFNYFNSALDNFFTLPVRKAPKGRYLLRVYVYWPQVCEMEAPIVVGLYSAAVVGIREVKGVDDQEFVEKNCISRALKSQNKQAIDNDPHSWICKEILANTNIGFVVFHYGAKSTVKDYTLKFDESGNKPLYFLCEYRGKDKFDIDCEKGYEYVVICAFVPPYESAMDKGLYPTYNPNFKLPSPEIIPHN